MNVGNSIIGEAEIASLMGWWRDAGLDIIAQDDPRDWLAAAELPALAPIVPNPAPSLPVTALLADMPDNLPAFLDFLATDKSIPLPIDSRLAPLGAAASGVMVLTDLPDEDDLTTGRILSGPPGRLFDKMMAAIGRDQSAIYLAAMAPGRPAGGYVDASSAALFGRFARHHVRLAQPRLLLLMGEAPTRALLGMGFVEARGQIHDVIINGRSVRALATFHPRILIQHPAQKARAWADLQMAMLELDL